MPTKPKTLLAACACALMLASPILLTGCGERPPEEQFEESIRLLQEGSIARGILRLRDLVERHPDDPVAVEAHLTLANYYFGEGSFDRALEHFRAVRATVDPLDDRALMALDGMTAVLANMGELDEALAMVDATIELVPEDEESLAFMLRRSKADLLLAANEGERRGEGDAMLRAMMLEMDPPFRHIAREHLASFYNRFVGDFEASNSVYAEYLEAFPDDELRPRLEMAMAINLRRADRQEDAEALFLPAAAAHRAAADAIEDNQEERNQALLELVSNYRAMGLFEQAEETMRTIMGENVRSLLAIQIQFGIAEMVIREVGDVERGIQLLEQIARENPGSSIEDTATQAITQVRRIQEQIAAAEAAAAAADEAEPSDDAPEAEDATEPEAEGQGEETP